MSSSLRTWLFVICSIFLLFLTRSSAAQGHTKGVKAPKYEECTRAEWQTQRLVWSDIKCYKATFRAKFPLDISSACARAAVDETTSKDDMASACKTACGIQIAQAYTKMVNKQKFQMTENRCMSKTQRPELTENPIFAGRQDNGVFCLCSVSITVDEIFRQLSPTRPLIPTEHVHAKQSPWSCEPDGFAKWFGNHISNGVPFGQIMTEYDMLEDAKECSSFRSKYPKKEEFRDTFNSKGEQMCPTTPSEKKKKVTRSKKKMLHDSAEEKTRKKSKQMQCTEPSEQETSSRSEVPSNPSVEPTALSPGPDTTKQIMDTFWGDIDFPDIVPPPWDEHEEL